MTVYALKPRFQALLRPLVARLARKGIRANQVTVATAFGSIVVGIAVAWAADRRAVFLVVPVWLLVRMALNAMDGMLAREFGHKSRLGGYLNEVGDVVSDAALTAPFALVAPFGPFGIGVVIVLSILTEFAGVLGPAAGASRRYDGPLGKSDRAIVFGALGLWIGLSQSLPPWLGWGVPAIAVLLALTVVNRIRAGLDEAERAAPPQPLTEPSHPGATMRAVEDKTFRSHDGVDLFYRHWPVASGTPRGAIVLFHRGHEHSGRMAHLADELNLPDFALFAWDARGHGRSPGERGFSPSVATSVHDVQTFVDHITTTYGIMQADMAIIAQSVGAVTVAAWAHDYAPGIRCMVLASPAFRVKLYIPFARTGLALMQALRGNFFVNSYVKPQFLTHDAERIASYRTDPLITRAIAVNILLGLYDTADRVVTDARAITIPTQLLISGSDVVVHHDPQHRFFERLGTPTKERHVLPGFYHDTLGEKNRAVAVDKARSFIIDRFAEPVNRPSLLEADRMGYTRDEADVLASPLRPLSWRGLFWAAARLNIRLGGLVSDGIRLGRRTGFDSGSTLDYVYRNQPGGLGPLGRLVGRTYLQSIGWRGIRQRKVHLEELLRVTMERLATSGMPVRIMDSAAGHGRYVLDAIDARAGRPESILLRDYADINVEAGRALIDAKGLGAIARFEKGDAFDRDGLAAVDPKPTLGIVSGLYELFPDNRMVQASLAGFAAAIPPGGYLIYTGQPWHPQLELIARTLTSHRQGQAWIMRRRTQAEMDQLVAAAGFRKIEQRIDEWGVFTVSVAERIAA
jgi:alpha-beta hydrolase superfamily lysophospholipase/phosphatidylglycerophosphate synthase